MSTFLPSVLSSTLFLIQGNLYEISSINFCRGSVNCCITNFAAEEVAQTAPAATETAASEVQAAEAPASEAPASEAQATEAQ